MAVSALRGGFCGGPGGVLGWSGWEAEGRRLSGPRFEVLADWETHLARDVVEV